jgi:hypothetical protein
MSKAVGPPSTNALTGVVGLVDLLVEHKIKLDALEDVLKETNPLVHELYLGTVEKLQAQKAAGLKKEVTARLSQNLAKAKG